MAIDNHSKLVGYEGGFFQGRVMGAVLERENPSYHYLVLFPGSTLILTLLSGKSLGMRLITTHISGNLANATAWLHTK